MTETEAETFEPALAVDMWVSYLEQFPHSDVTIQTLLNLGYSYAELITLFKECIRNNEPLSLQTLAGHAKR
jgi:hypothetical protein